MTGDKVRDLHATRVRPGASADIRRLSRWLTAATAGIIIAGTVVTGTGPHAEDSNDVSRMPSNWSMVTIVHASLVAVAVAVAVALGLALGLWRAARHSGNAALRNRSATFVVLLLAQGAVRVIQVATNLPELVVVLHLFGAALVWIGVRVHLATRRAGYGEDALIEERVPHEVAP
jgi:cytochrome c oxidase assembly protein subunit 15